MGLDARRNPRPVKEIIGVQLQTTVFFDELTVRETIDLFGAFYPRTLAVDELVALAELQEKANARGRRTLWGAAQAVLHRPGAGQRPQHRLPRRAHHRPRSPGPAPHLGDGGAPAGPGQDGGHHHPLHRGGRVPLRPRGGDGPRAHHRPGHARTSSSTSTSSDSIITFRLTPPVGEEVVGGLHGVVEHGGRGRRVQVTTAAPQETLIGIVAMAHEQGVKADDINMKRATLEDVFLKITGRRIRE